ANFPRTDSPDITGFYRVAGCSTGTFGKVNTGCRCYETRMCLCHYSRDIQEVIEVSVRYQNRVDVRRRSGEMTQSIVDSGGVWLNARTKCYAQKIHAREVRIDKQGVSFEFELVPVRAEISHA